MTQNESDIIFDTITLVGVGLIGGSLAVNIKERRLARRLIGYDANSEAQKDIEILGLVDHRSDDLGWAAAQADLLIFCVPVCSIKGLAMQIASRLKKGVIVSDVGSVKQQVISDLEATMPEYVQIIGGHPLAGTENSGPQARLADLFENRWVVLTPHKSAKTESLERIKKLWQQVGASVEVMGAEHHDRVLAMTSHLPHVLAYCLVHSAMGLEEHEQMEVIRFSASGFRDFTRIAGSNPVMWRDIFLTNKEAVLEMLQRFTEELTALQRNIRYGEGEALQKVFTQTRAVRRGVIEAGQAGTFDAREPKKQKA